MREHGTEHGTEQDADLATEAVLAALADSEERFRLALDNAAIGMCLTTPEGHFLRVNPALCRLFDRRPEELMACTWQELTHADDLEADLSLFGDVIQGRRDSYRLLKRFLRRDGSLVWGDMSVSCVREADGRVRHFIAQVIDVTEQQLTLATLDATLASMLDPYLLVGAVRDHDGQLVDLQYEMVNEAACRYLGRSLAELVGRTVSQLYPGEAARRLLDWCGLAFDSAAPLVLDDTPLVSAITGEPRWFDVRAVRIGDSVSFTWRDVTDRHLAAAQLADEEARYRLLADHVTDVIVRSERGGTIAWASPSLREVLGWREEDLIGRRLSEFMHPEDLAEVVQLQRAIIAAGGHEGRTTARFRTADGTWRWMSDHGRAILDGDGRIAGGIDSLRDVQQEHETRQLLEQRERELRGIIDTLLDPWVLLSAVRDEQGAIVDFVYVDANEAACAHNHITRDELIGQRLLTLLPEHVPTGIFARYVDVVETGEPLADDDEPFTSSFDGRTRRFDNRVVKVGDGISLTWRDVTERYEARQQLRHQADHDLLTGAVSRRELERRMAEILERLPRTGRRTAVLYCDIDHFKGINDSLGHEAGDRVLASAVEAIRHAVRESDVVGRLGGDEFVVVLDGVRDDADARAVAEKVALAIRAPVAVSDPPVRPRMSIGVAMAHEGEGPEDLLARADRALYSAKQAGRDRVVVAPRPGEEDRHG